MNRFGSFFVPLVLAGAGIWGTLSTGSAVVAGLRHGDGPWVLFVVVFMVVFFMIGAAGIHHAVRAWRPAQPGSGGGRTISSDSSPLRFWIGIGALNAILLPIVGLLVYAGIRTSAFFFILAAAFLWWAIGSSYQLAKAASSWPFYGETRLTLDSDALRVGDVVAGSIAFDRGAQAGMQFTVKLACKTMNEDGPPWTVWEEEIPVTAARGVKGVELRFRFEPPVQLPVSKDVGSILCQWTIGLAGGTADATLERDFAIDVRPGPARASSQPGPQFAPEVYVAPAALTPIPASLARAQEEGGTLVVDYPAFRNLRMGLLAIAAGASALAFTGYVISLPVVFPVWVAIIAAAGLSALAFGAHLAWSRFTVTVAHGQITVRRAGVFARGERNIGVAHVVAIVPAVQYQAGNAPRSTYAIHARLSTGELVALGVGLKGERAVAALCSRFATALRLDPEQVLPVDTANSNIARIDPMLKTGKALRN